jgi:putative photosynthetic complex assembly protein 2
VAEHGLPVLYALFLWWFSTGLILYLDGLPRRSFRWSMLVATGLLGAALYGLVASSGDTSVGGAYAGFTCGLVIWGWHEISFLTGYVTGPRRTPCPEGCAGWQHFVYATQTILHHELAIPATAALVVVLTWGEENQVGTWTFVILWGMRLSAKLNVFLGVPNLAEEFLPEHLHYLKSYLAKRPMNLLFPVSVTVATIVAALLVQQATHAEAMAFEAAGLTFLAALMALAILEHWFLVVSVPDAALWGWALRARSDAAAPADAQAAASVPGPGRPAPANGWS